MFHLDDIIKVSSSLSLVITAILAS